MKLRNGCGDHVGRKKQCVDIAQRLRRPRGAKTTRILTPRSGCGDQGEAKNINVLKPRTCCGDQGGDNKEMC